MSDRRDQMNKALKEIVIPILRASVDFSGSFPHFPPSFAGAHRFIKLSKFDLYGGGFRHRNWSMSAGRNHLLAGVNKSCTEKVKYWDLPPEQRTQDYRRVLAQAKTVGFGLMEQKQMFSLTLQPRSVIPFT